MVLFILFPGFGTSEKYWENKIETKDNTKRLSHISGWIKKTLYIEEPSEACSSQFMSLSFFFQYTS